MGIDVKMDKSKVDYSLYLVTDSTTEILGQRDIATVVESAIQGGVTIVQYRDKTSDTAELIRVATKLHNVTKSSGVPLLINDRVDVALAAGAEGVHLGQDDMDLPTARRLLGTDAIIGASVTSPQEASNAIKEGADYLGIGTVFSTPTKRDTKSVIGISGVRSILASLPQSIPTVCIGGLNASNAQRVLFQTRYDGIEDEANPQPSRELSGIAVVSAIVASSNPSDSASNLSRLVHSSPPFAFRTSRDPGEGLEKITSKILRGTPHLHSTVADQKPLSHNMTNQVVTNFAANVAIAVGASPIMSQNGAEASDLAALKGGLVINMGTVTPEMLSNYKVAVNAYNALGNPVILDPVGGGATGVRRRAIREILDAGYYDVMKGNEAEIRTLLREGGDPFAPPDYNEVVQHGVDSNSAGGEGLSEPAKANVVKTLARRERNAVLMTGPIDYLSDGRFVFAIENGHRYLGEITGGGCTLGTTIAAFAAIARREEIVKNESSREPRDLQAQSELPNMQTWMLQAVLSAVLIFEIAAELAVVSEESPFYEWPSGIARPSLNVNGPGSFVPAFLDALNQLKEAARTKSEQFAQFYTSRAKVRVL